MNKFPNNLVVREKISQEKTWRGTDNGGYI